VAAQRTAPARWNLLVYAIAGTDEELARVEHAIDTMDVALKEIQAALPANACNVAVQVHARSKTERTWISEGRRRTDTLPVLDAGDWSTLKNFLNAANQNFSKKSSSAPRSNLTALVLWAHSAGPKEEPRPRKAVGFPGDDQVFAGRAASGHDTGVDVEERASHEPAHVPHHPRHYGCSWGPDPNTGDSLTVAEVKKAIAASIRHRVDILGLNACGMAFLEVAYELRGVADVQIASQVEAKPWPYSALVQRAAPGVTAEQLAIAFVREVRIEIDAGRRPDAISALLSDNAVEDAAVAVDAYAKRVYELIDKDWESVVKAATMHAWRVDVPYMVDLVSLLDALGKGDLEAETAANVVKRKFRALLLATAASHGHPHLHGLSIFCPKTTYQDIGAAYTGLEFRNHSWRHFLIKFQQRLTRKP
jgi:hypothetical protein